MHIYERKFSLTLFFCLDKPKSSSSKYIIQNLRIWACELAHGVVLLVTHFWWHEFNPLDPVKGGQNKIYWVHNVDLWPPSMCYIAHMQTLTHKHTHKHAHTLIMHSF